LLLRTSFSQTLPITNVAKKTWIITQSLPPARHAHESRGLFWSSNASLPLVGRNRVFDHGCHQGVLPLVGDRTANIPDCGRPFRFTVMNQLGTPGHRRLMVLRHQPNGMDRIQRSTFCCSLLGIPDSASVGGLSANQAKVKATSKICFRLPSGGFGALPMLSNHWPTTLILRYHHHHGSYLALNRPIFIH
jgi:hypothetical protein